MTHTDLSLQHLQAELMRLDVLIRREVWRWQRAGQNPAEQFRGLYLSDEQATQLATRPFGTSWGHTVEPNPAEAQAFNTAETQAIQKVLTLVQEAEAAGQSLRLTHLASTFELDRFATDALLICLAPHLDLRYERLYAYLQDDMTRKWPTVDLILNLLAPPGAVRLPRLAYFDPDAPLFKYHLLEHVTNPNNTSPNLLTQPLQIDPAIQAWLLGRYQPHATLSGHTTYVTPTLNPEDQLLSKAAWETLEPALDNQASLIVFHGPDILAQHAAARLVAVKLQRPLLQVNMATATSTTDTNPQDLLRLALRDARLINAIPYLTGWDTCLVDGTAPPFLLRELFTHPGPAIIGGENHWHAQGIKRERTLLWIEFPLPSYAQRQKLWTHFANHNGDTNPAVDLTPLAGQFILSTGQIRDAVATAKDLATQRNTPLENDILFAAARAHSNPRLSGLARKIIPRYGWDDIILPEDQLAILHEIVATVRSRPKVLEEWGVGKKLAASNGVTILFAGEPGTGKTMSAEVIAADLGLDLYKIDLSSVVSKYIGETEKNLERIFNEAQSSNAILFFDEADALFGKRSEVKDAHDRYANLEISYLLQRMEAYDGVTILATNLRANLDEAFTRRLQFALDIPFPEEEYRLRIWKTLFPPKVPCDSDLDFELMAQRFKLAGGNIRNIIVTAAYLAAAEDSVVTMQHLLHATRRELQKMGRLVHESDMNIL